jgi:hypothetical protein
MAIATLADMVPQQLRGDIPEIDAMPLDVALALGLIPFEFGYFIDQRTPLPFELEPVFPSLASITSGRRMPLSASIDRSRIQLYIRL